MTLVEIRWCGKKALCPYCDSEIHKGDAALVWQRYNRKKGWRVVKYYHPECWIKERLFYLSDRPKPIDGRGRPKLPLCEDDKYYRRRLLKNYSYWSTRSGGLAISKRKEIRTALEKVGGIPANWT